MHQVQQTCSCGRKYWPTQAWQHNGCAINKDKPAAINTITTRTPNRRERVVYNEYMREYMRKRRAETSR